MTIPVLAVRLEHNIFAKNEVRCCLLRSLAERLAFLRAVDAIQADALRLWYKDFDRIAVDYRDDEGGEPRSPRRQLQTGRLRMTRRTREVSCGFWQLLKRSMRFWTNATGLIIRFRVSEEEIITLQVVRSI